MIRKLLFASVFQNIPEFQENLICALLKSLLYMKTVTIFFFTKREGNTFITSNHLLVHVHQASLRKLRIKITFFLFVSCYFWVNKRSQHMHKENQITLNVKNEIITLTCIFLSNFSHYHQDYLWMPLLRRCGLRR